jgi:basic membrane protein A
VAGLCSTHPDTTPPNPTKYNGTFVGKDALLGVDTGSTGYVSAEGRQQLGEDALAKLAETYERLQKGEIVPPTTADGVNDFPGLK